MEATLFIFVGVCFNHEKNFETVVEGVELGLYEIIKNPLDVYFL